MDQLYSYTVRYRRNGWQHDLNRHTLIVAATDADDARREASRLDPLYLSTIESPRRGRAVEVPDGIDLAKREDDIGWATWRDTEVEVI